MSNRDDNGKGMVFVIIFFVILFFGSFIHLAIDERASEQAQVEQPVPR